MTTPSVIRDRKLRLALVGCGRIAQNHFAALNAPPASSDADQGVSSSARRSSSDGMHGGSPRGIR